MVTGEYAIRVYRVIVGTADDFVQCRTCQAEESTRVHVAGKAEGETRPRRRYCDGKFFFQDFG